MTFSGLICPTSFEKCSLTPLKISLTVSSTATLREVASLMAVAMLDSTQPRVAFFGHVGGEEGLEEAGDGVFTNSVHIIQRLLRILKWVKSLQLNTPREPRIIGDVLLTVGEERGDFLKLDDFKEGVAGGGFVEDEGVVFPHGC